LSALLLAGLFCVLSIPSFISLFMSSDLAAMALSCHRPFNRWAQFEAESMGHWVAIEYFSGNRSPIVEKLRDKRFFTTSSGN
jgi:hypothetical protein